MDITVPNKIEFELEGDEFTVDDANSLESWVLGLSTYIQEKADEHYTYAFDDQSERHDVPKDTQREIAKAVGKAFSTFRKSASITEGDGPKDSWEWVVRDAVRTAIGFDRVDNHWCPQEDSLDSSDFKRLRDYLEDIIDEHEGDEITLDATEIYDEIYSHVIYKMQELDPSSELSAYGKPAIKFIFVPGLTPSGSIDDTTIYLDNLQKMDPESEGFEVLMRLSGVDAVELMEELNVDHTDTDLIDKWLSYHNGNAAETPLLPIKSSDEFNLINILENAGVNYGTPMWMGELSVNQIIALNPLEDIYLSGGSLGINDFTNGAGWMADMPKRGCIKLGQEDLITMEYGYEMECEKASISNAVPELKKKFSFDRDDGPAF